MKKIFLEKYKDCDLREEIFRMNQEEYEIGRASCRERVTESASTLLRQGKLINLLEKFKT